MLVSSRRPFYDFWGCSEAGENYKSQLVRNTRDTNDDKYTNSGFMTRTGNCTFSFNIILLQDRFTNTVGITLLSLFQYLALHF